jgi:NADPH:quinone reductase-like Zn-dependent oxidoreductase
VLVAEMWGATRQGCASVFPVSYLTAFALLVVMGSLRKGDRVLIQSAAGARRLMNDSKGVLGVHIGHFRGQERKVRAWTEQLLAWYDEGRLSLRVDRAFAFSEAPAAHQYLQDRKATGKVVLVP